MSRSLASSATPAPLTLSSGNPIARWRCYRRGWPTPVEALRRLLPHPRLPVERLADLRALVDALMASCSGELPRCEGAGDVESATQSEGPVRRDAPRVADLRPDLRNKLALLLQVLLAEAASVQQQRTKSVDRSGGEDG